MKKFCLYADSHSEVPCVYLFMYKYSYLSDLISNERHEIGEVPYSVPLRIKCLKRSENSSSKFSIKDECCINCMFCVFGCIGNRILLSNSYHPQKFCYDLSETEFSMLEERASSLFKGEFIKLPKVPISQFTVKYKSFEEFTSTDETRNIAVWTANAMKFLSSSLEPRISLEVGLQIRQRNRGGRLDVCLLNLKDKFLFVAETKVDFDHMIKEGRYEAQMIAYETELGQIPKELKRAKFLVIGGDESDLLPCNINPHAKLFYDVLRKHKLFFVSANALLALGLYKLYVSNNYTLESLFHIMTNEQYLGLLSAGVVTRDEKIIPLNEALI